MADIELVLVEESAAESLEAIGQSKDARVEIDVVILAESAKTKSVGDSSDERIVLIRALALLLGHEEVPASALNETGRIDADVLHDVFPVHVHPVLREHDILSTR